MKKQHYYGCKLIALLITVIAILFFLSPKADASYLYDFQFSQLIYNEQTYAADGFSFISPQLIGPGDGTGSREFAGSPYIPELTFSSPVFLNGSAFNSITCGFTWTAPLSVETLQGLTFTQYPPNSDAGIGDVTDFFVGITFDPGTYGPGYYGSNRFGRAIRNENGSSSCRYVAGSLTITEVGVPEPSVMLLLWTGLAGLIFVRRETNS